MKDQYFADLGDYGKYGLLRFLAERGVKIGINWYLTPDDGSTDGKYTEYLSQPMKEWMVDTRLFEDLSKIYKKQKRTVRNVEAANLIPQASYYSICLSQDELSAREREINRNRWFEDSLNVLKEAELIFADPDNGISCSATARTKNNEKYYSSRVVLLISLIILIRQLVISHIKEIHLQQSTTSCSIN